MNFNVYVGKRTGERLNKAAKTAHRSRNSIVNEALEQWLTANSQEQWPKSFFEYDPIEEVPDFESYRKELGSINEDPLK